MKNKISCLVIVVIMIAGSTCAQTADHRASEEKKLAIGVSIGLNYANLDANSSFPTFGPNDVAKLGPIAGGVVEHKFHDHISVQSGVLYVSAGAKTEEFIGTDEFGKVVGSFHFVQDLRYLEFPILLSYNFPISSLSLFFSGGSNIGVLLSAKEEKRADYESSPPYCENIKDKLKSVNIIISLGTGALFSLGPSYHLKLEVKYGRGLVNQIKEETEARFQKSQDIRLISTISFAL